MNLVGNVYVYVHLSCALVPEIEGMGCTKEIPAVGSGADLGRTEMRSTA
jgi:hypothetical protein